MMGRNYWQWVRQARATKGPEQHTAGFTIVETLIVLAITGLIFVSVAGLIAGRQRQTEFDQAIQDTQNKLQQIMNEVSNNYYPYPSDATFSCSNGTIQTGSNPGQGANQGCIFVGKAISFDTSDSNQHNLDVYPLVGKQFVTAGQPVQQLYDAHPHVINQADVLNVYPLLYGLTLQSITYTDSVSQPTPRNVATVAFVNLGGSATTSGATQVNALPVTNGALGDTESTLIGDTETFLTSTSQSTLTGLLDPDGGVQLCFASGGTDQSGLITIGGAGRVLNVSLQIKNGQTC